MSSGAAGTTVGGGNPGGLGTSAAANASAARASASAKNAKTGQSFGGSRGKGQANALGSNKATGNSAKNTVGYAKDNIKGSKNGDYDKHRSNKAGGTRGPARDRKTLYGYESQGPKRAMANSIASPPGKKKVRTQVEEASSMLTSTPSSSNKIDRKVQDDITRVGARLSHDRVGEAQKMCTFGSHRRTHNWAQPGVAKKQLLGPFSDHMSFTQRVPQGH